MSRYEAGFHVAGQKVLWTDLAGNACALGTVWPATRRTVWTWPVQLTGAVYGVFLVLVLNGYRDWRRIWQARSAHTPRPEAVAK